MQNVLLANHLAKDGLLGGAELYLWWLAQKLKATSSYHPIFLSPSPGEITRQAERAGIDQAVFDVPILWDLLGSRWDMRKRVNQFLSFHQTAIRAFETFLQSRRIDLVIANCLVNVIPQAAARNLGVPVIWMINEVFDAFGPLSYGPGYFVRRTICRGQMASMFRRYADHLIFLSEHSYGSFKTNRFASQSSVIYLPIFDYLYQDALERSKPDEPHQPFTIGFAGVHVPHKGVIDFLEAANVIAQTEPRVRFLLSGALQERLNPDLIFQRLFSLMQNLLDENNII